MQWQFLNRHKLRNDTNFSIHWWIIPAAIVNVKFQYQLSIFLIPSTFIYWNSSVRRFFPFIYLMYYVIMDSWIFYSLVYNLLLSLLIYCSYCLPALALGAKVPKKTFQVGSCVLLTPPFFLIFLTLNYIF